MEAGRVAGEKWGVTLLQRSHSPLQIQPEPTTPDIWLCPALKGQPLLQEARNANLNCAINSDVFINRKINSFIANAVALNQEKSPEKGLRNYRIIARRASFIMYVPFIISFKNISIYFLRMSLSLYIMARTRAAQGWMLAYISLYTNSSSSSTIPQPSYSSSISGCHPTWTWAFLKGINNRLENGVLLV